VAQALPRIVETVLAAAREEHRCLKSGDQQLQLQLLESAAQV
jgi:hypothetical protein